MPTLLYPLQFTYSISQLKYYLIHLVLSVTSQKNSLIQPFLDACMTEQSLMLFIYLSFLQKYFLSVVGNDCANAVTQR